MMFRVYVSSYVTFVRSPERVLEVGKDALEDIPYVGMVSQEDIPDVGTDAWEEFQDVVKVTQKDLPDHLKTRKDQIRKKQKMSMVTQSESDLTIPAAEVGVRYLSDGCNTDILLMDKAFTVDGCG